MKIYKLSIECFGYDTYDGFVVIAKNRKDAIDFVVTNKPRGDEGKEIWKTAKVEYLGESKKKNRQFILMSFNAG